MDSLLNSLENFKINGSSDQLTGQTVPCYISDIFSPARLYVQLCEPEISKVMDDLGNFYKISENAETFQLKPDQVKVGLKIALYACNEWHRAEILSELTSSDTVYVLMYDYGTNGFVELDNCKILLDEFNVIKRKSIRSCLYGVAPVNSRHRLFPLSATKFIIKNCYNKIYNVQFVTYHEEGDFYEIIARDGSGKSLNEQLIMNSFARFYNPIQRSQFSIHYPSFELLERSPVYQNYSHRLSFEERGINFNDFEENYINPDCSYEEQFKMWMKDHRFKKIRELYERFVR